MLYSKFDNTIRWQEGERLNDLFERRVDLLEQSGHFDHPAVVTEDRVYSYRELDNRANQVARYLLDAGVKPGDRIGLLFDKSYQTYVALLAVLKVDAAYVPLDASFPQDRVSYILEDAGATRILSLAQFLDNLSGLEIEKTFLDCAEKEIDAYPTDRIDDREKGDTDSELAYIIYTSGTTGNPKGVTIEHPSICNFVNVAGEVYGITQHDRVYQGMTIAFDFSVEELWVPLIVGATLVPGRSCSNLVGSDLHEFLSDNQISVLCCVPTLLATIEDDLPELRILLVSGEACPQDLVLRWHREGRTMLNAYGPTEATVTATITELLPEKSVTIGGPLPTYAIVILDEFEAKTIPDGDVGEICIAGIGLARDYLNREDLTRQKFIEDFLDIENNPSKRIYRTGDLGRITEDGEIEYLGRIDTQVKIRGYRIELTEIESIILKMPGIAQAVVDTYESEPGYKELVAYYSLKSGHADVSAEAIASELRAHVPGYMVPAYYEHLDIVPMTNSHKADRKNLPVPKGPRFVASSDNYVEATSDTEIQIAEALAEILKIEKVSIEDNFFNDLGAHSLLMAKYCSLVREKMPDVEISMKDIYLNPTIAKLAAFLDNQAASESSADKINETPYRVANDFDYYSCWFYQTLYYFTLLGSGTWLFMECIIWLFSSTSYVEANIRGVTIITGFTALYTIVPIALKWLLIGRWKPQTFPIWGLRYFRFWMVQNLINLSPFALFRGLPLYNIYLRCLGARIGKNVVINSRDVPVCADLIEIGDNSVISREVIMKGYRASSGYIEIGPVEIGKNAFVGANSVLDIHTKMGDNTQLGHVSSLQSHQSVPDGQRYHGSPAVPTEADYCKINSLPCSGLRRFVYSLIQLFSMLVLAAVVPIGVFYLTSPILVPLFKAQSFTSMSLLLLILTPLFMAGGLLFALLYTILVPRFLSRFIITDKEYVLYGFHYFIANFITSTSNSDFFNMLFGDSSFITSYLTAIGWNLNKIDQTGSNFGTDQAHDMPLLCEVGDGTMVADGLTMMNMYYNNSTFKMTHVAIGPHNYLGNLIYYPHDAKLGANCLIATKAMVPIDGPVKENVGILGSPCFEIPRATARDKEMSSMDEGERREMLARKNKHNLFTMACYLSMHVVFSYAMLVFFYSLYAFYNSDYYAGTYTLVITPMLFGAFSILYFGVIERMTFGFRRMQPVTCTIYDPYFWKVEHYWKHSDSLIRYLFYGTPYKNILSRLMGAKIGRKVYDDGCFITEKMLVEVGDYCTLNRDSMLQSHSLEEGVFKSEMIKLEKGCTVGPVALIHYGATLGENTIVNADSFFMKGETSEPNTVWCGNPAK